MFRQYLVVSSYVAAIPEGKDKTQFILEAVYNDLSVIPKEQLMNYLESVFNVIEGDEVEVDEGEEDE